MLIVLDRVSGFFVYENKIIIIPYPYLVYDDTFRHPSRDSR